MSSRKTVLLITLGSALTLITGLIVGSEVRAGEGGLDPDDLPIASMVTPDTLAQAQAFEGDWVYVGGQKQRDGIDEAIAVSVNALSPLVRNLGTKRLSESNPVPSKISIRVNGERAKILFDGEGHETKLDGTPVKTSAKGEKVKVSQQMRGDALYQFNDGVGGDRHNTFKLSADGQKLTLQVKISSRQLPVPVEYRLSFKRG